MGFDSVLPAVAVAAFAVAWGVTWLCCRPGSWLYFLDHPNARSLHVRPTPRTGGVGVMVGVLAAGVWLAVFGRPGWPEGLALLERGAVRVDEMITERYALRDAPRAFARAAQRGALKVLLYP